MLVLHHSQYFHSLHLPQKDLMRLFVAGLSRRISQTFVSIFSSVFIYQTSLKFGYSSRVAVLFAFSFFLLLMFIKSLALVAAEEYSRVHGFKSTIIASLLPFVLSIISFILSDRNLLFLIPAAVFWGIHAGFYWLGYHGYFVKTGSSDNFGKSLGEVGLLETLAVVLTPIVGSIVIESYGFYAVYLLSFIFMTLAILLMLKAHDQRPMHDVKIKEIFALYNKHRSTTLAYAGSTMESTIYTIAWPLFLYIFADNILEVGVIISLAVLLSAVFGIMIGDFDDKYGEKKLVSYGTPLIIGSWILRTIFRSLGFFVAADALWNFGQKMVTMPLNALSYRKAARKVAVRAILFRELAITLGAEIGIILAILVYLLTESFTSVFLLAIIFSTFPLIAVLKGELNDKQK